MKHTVLFLLILTFSFSVEAQLKISGIISDEIELLRDVNIIVKSTSRGAVTNDDGYFEIVAKKGDTLSMSFIGYKTQEVIVSNQKKINIILDSNVELDEVVINAFGSTRCVQRLYCGFSVTHVNYYNFKSDQRKATLFPNPSANGLFKLSLLNDYRKVQIRVSNMSGQLIKTINYQNVVEKVIMDMSQFPTGIYIINIIADGKQLDTKKAVIGS